MAASFEGWDPYDALSAPALRAIARTRLLRGAVIQALKRSPVNLRPLLGVPRRAHTKALALLVSGYATLARLPGGGEYRNVALELADRLAKRAVPADGGAGFGYDFDVQTRWAYYRCGTPNAVATAFAAHAFLDASALGDYALRQHARAALRYACDRLLVEDAGERYFAYFEGSTTPIHNASLLLAGLAARMPDATGEHLAAAQDAVSYSLARQRPDGSWPYGEAPGLGWVDGLHTAYVLENLGTWVERTGDAVAATGLARGLDFYLHRLIDPDGAARATADSRFPIDTHACASAVTALARLGRHDARALPAAGRVLAWVLAHLRRHDGRFAFQVHRRYRNSIPYIRWSDGHMLLALAAYLETKETRSGA